MHYLWRLGLLTLVLLVASLITSYQPDLLAVGHKWSISIVLLFSIMTFFQHHQLIKSGTKSPSAFVRSFMGMTILKMILLVAGFVVALLLNVPDQNRFTGWFIMTYISFTVFEVIQLSRELRKAR